MSELTRKWEKSVGKARSLFRAGLGVPPGIEETLRDIAEGLKRIHDLLDGGNDERTTPKVERHMEAAENRKR